MRFLLVDGHNIIHAWPELREKHRGHAGSRSTARELLLQRLRQYQDLTEERVIVVFDGPQARVTEEREPEGLQIFYADAGTTADVIIERLITKYAGTHQMTAATADGMVRNAVLAAGADWISPESLKQLCEKADADLQRRLKKRR